jgi:hypothetical protein
VVIGPTHHRIRTRLAPEVMTRLLQSCPCPLLVAPAREAAKVDPKLPPALDHNRGLATS